MFRRERGALNFPPREATQTFFTKLKSLSVSNIQIYAHENESGTRPI